MAKYGFVREIDIKKIKTVLTLIVKKYNFINPNFKVLDKQLKDNLTNLALL